MVEGAAIRHHDNVFGGLQIIQLKCSTFSRRFSRTIHRFKQARISSFSPFSCTTSEKCLNTAISTWVNSGMPITVCEALKFLAALKDTIIERYDESFYRQVQSVIAGHHGLYGDRPTTVAATIIHYIDMLESQTTEIIREQNNTPGNRIRHPDFGFLYDIPLAEKE